MTREALIARLTELPRLIRDEEETFLVLTLAQTRAEAQAVLDGNVEGKNETERKAKLRLLTLEQEEAAGRQRAAVKALEHELWALRSVAQLLGPPSAGGE